MKWGGDRRRDWRFVCTILQNSQRKGNYSRVALNITINNLKAISFPVVCQPGWELKDYGPVSSQDISTAGKTEFFN